MCGYADVQIMKGVFSQPTSLARSNLPIGFATGPVMLNLFQHLSCLVYHYYNPPAHCRGRATTFCLIKK